ncbi:type II toxin-antitoxin system death-on-curing family toxin [Microbulbifer sp. THAF38]|uniref:type II toxin-antitoxin system death-on-curing family toxin n=1 Tax=Microbulbifer sp. THAF38 TaxID=2587856 RepID=UPI0012679048|nr:type II toxin-antitoxin system death-on-curing family toxin [Microbulbifer sp. THAF38]QFT53552.1 Fic/DOC family protein [Microbulbifer sp. THAF38]
MVNVDDLSHLDASDIEAIHDSILEQYPGLPGNKPGMSAEAVVGRIFANIYYRQFSGIEQVAAIYAEAIARGHVFNDGNKRTALVSTFTFLEGNGFTIVAPDDVLADWIVDLAEGKRNNSEFAMWLKGKLRRLRTTPEVELL